MARFNIPESNRLVVRSADKAFAFQQQRSAVVGVTGQETDVLRKAIFKIGLPMVQGAIQWFPGNIQVSSGGAGINCRSNSPAVRSLGRFEGHRVCGSDPQTMILPKTGMVNHLLPFPAYGFDVE